jgi:LmbE family N-acetylglucosaminyl deacetylase
MRVIIACSTRGEGGQNVLGPERLGVLGVLRSRELEEAARVLDADIAWLGHGPSDPVHDFGFSKDGDATFTQWGERRVVERLVRAYRTERPDIVIPTFLDVPGQHGHHRAMTRAAEKAVALAADPAAFPEHFAEGLKPWKVSKYYLPAWSGAGDAYDDELPPPDATLVVAQQAREPASGTDYDRIGEWSRYYHASQGMGHWREKPQVQWPLHLVTGPQGQKTEASIADDLPSTLAALAAFENLPVETATSLVAAQIAIDAALSAFPDRAAIIAALLDAARAIEAARSTAPQSFLDLHGHRLQRKAIELDAAVLQAAAVFDRAFFKPGVLSPGATGTLTVEFGPDAVGLAATAVAVLPHGVEATGQIGPGNGKLSFSLTAAADAPLSNLYLPSWSALGGNSAAHVRVTAIIGGRAVSGTFDLEEPFAVVPSHSLSLKPEAFILPTSNGQRQLSFAADISDANAPLSFILPQGWTMERQENKYLIAVPEHLDAGLASIKPEIDGAPAFRITPISYPHIGRTSFRAPESLNLLALDLKLPDGAKVGYVGGGADRVGLWLSRMGLDVTELDAVALSGDLSRYTTIVVGIFAFGTRPDLLAALQRLHRFVENGGHLVTLYHRPSDGWNPETVPPLYLSIGLPSLRWRVTDPNTEVTVLEPQHRLLTRPNVIGPQDWQNWNKERGLYFASRWDDAYQPLLAMHDTNEQPLKGALLSAQIGKGRHTHTSLVLHHQLDKLVPGAFRLMANLVQPA